MREDNERRAQRVRTTELQLEQETRTQTQLQAERQRLLDDLQSRELTFNELESRLAELQRLNAASLAATQEQQRQKAARERQLSEASRQVKDLRPDSTLPQAAKAERLDAARRKLRKTLELLADT